MTRCVHRDHRDQQWPHDDFRLEVHDRGEFIPFSEELIPPEERISLQLFWNDYRIAHDVAPMAEDDLIARKCHKMLKAALLTTKQVGANLRVVTDLPGTAAMLRRRGYKGRRASRPRSANYRSKGLLLAIWRLLRKPASRGGFCQMEIELRPRLTFDTPAHLIPHSWRYAVHPTDSIRDYPVHPKCKFSDPVFTTPGAMTRGRKRARRQVRRDVTFAWADKLARQELTTIQAQLNALRRSVEIALAKNDDKLATVVNQLDNFRPHYEKRVGQILADTLARQGFRAHPDTIAEQIGLIVLQKFRSSRARRIDRQQQERQLQEEGAWCATQERRRKARKEQVKNSKKATRPPKPGIGQRIRTYTESLRPPIAPQGDAPLRGDSATSPDGRPGGATEGSPSRSLAFPSTTSSPRRSLPTTSDPQKISPLARGHSPSPGGVPLRSGFPPLYRAPLPVHSS